MSTSENLEVKSVAATAPPVRMVLIEARTHLERTPDPDDAGETPDARVLSCSDGSHFCTHVYLHPVVGIETRLMADGTVGQVPQVVAYGRLAGLDVARSLYWHRSSAERMVVCAWPAKRDKAMLAEDIRDCVNRSIVAEVHFARRKL